MLLKKLHLNRYKPLLKLYIATTDTVNHTLLKEYGSKQILFGTRILVPPIEPGFSFDGFLRICYEITFLLTVLYMLVYKYALKSVFKL